MTIFIKKVDSFDDIKNILIELGCNNKEIEMFIQDKNFNLKDKKHLIIRFNPKKLSR